MNSIFTFPNNRRGAILSLVSVAITSSISAQDNAAPEFLTLDGMSWKTVGNDARIEQHMGRESIYLMDSAVELEGVDFKDGTVEYDIAVGPEWAFMGGWFRDDGMGSHEQFYMRPRQTDRDDALQYMPKLHGIGAWQLYIGPGYSANTSIKTGDWNHVKIAVNGKRAEIFFNNMDDPAIVIRELKTGITSGSVGFFTANQGAHFSNIRIDQTVVPALSAALPALLEPSPGTIWSWDISSPFAKSEIADLNTLPKGYAGGLTWTKMAVEDSGIVNIARQHGNRKGNTSYARVIIHAKKRQIIRLKFGYSDEAAVFLNQTRLYTGKNIWRSRDVRYLGTIGLFDEVPLQLKRGKNELLIAVTEYFGGWGVIGQLPASGSFEIVK